MNNKTITIIGGGIAGLSAAVFLTERKFNVRLIEGSPKFGGRAYSFYDKEKEIYFDNGQHILAGWYKNTFEYLKIIGTYNKLNFQKALQINFVDKNQKVYKLRCPKVFAPLNIIIGLWMYNGFSFFDKVRLLKVLRLINKERFPDKMISEMTVKILFNILKQSKNSTKMFWNPFIYAVFNTTTENVNALIFVNILKIGFTKINHSNLVIPNVNLNSLLVNDALSYLERNDVRVQNNSKIKKIKIENHKVKHLELDNGEKIQSDLFISAVPFFSFKEMFDSESFADNFKDTDKLLSSTIVSVHLFFKDDIPEQVLQENSYGITGLIDTKVQWIFKRSSKHLLLVISAADYLEDLSEKGSEEIFKICKEELGKCIKGFDDLFINDYKILKEKRATFIPDVSSSKYRANPVSKIKNLFIAGDWTDTGLPSTIESAVTSSKKITEVVSKLNN